MYYIIYEIMNIETSQKYRGKHKTKNLDDNYYGSGLWLKRAIIKHGIDKFTKTIIFMAFNEIDLNWAESVLVDDEWLQGNVYNLKRGGVGGFKPGMILTQDGRYITLAEFHNTKSIGIAKNKVAVYDSGGNRFQVDTTDPRLQTGDLVRCFHKSGAISAIDSNGNYVRISKSEYKSGKYTSIYKGTVAVKEYGKSFRVSINDPRYISGELSGNTKGMNMMQNTYFIYNEIGELIFTCNERIIDFIKKHRLPSVLIKSYQQNGKPIYQDLGSNETRLISSGKIQYKGWFCISKKKRSTIAR